jgi:hypothetical protein
MKKTVTSIDRTDQREKHITAFSAVKQEYGLKIEVVGCVKLCPTRNTSKNVIGIVELNDQTVPILDLRKEKTADIADLCCIVILESLIGDTTIMTGRLYENSCRIFDLIIECMDSPISHDCTQEYSVGSENDTVSSLALLQ